MRIFRAKKKAAMANSIIVCSVDDSKDSLTLKKADFELGQDVKSNTFSRAERI